MKRYQGDPYWLTARFNSKCHGDKGNCQQGIKKGEQAFYYPNGKHIYAVPCGHAESNSVDFESHAFDEMIYNS